MKIIFLLLLLATPVFAQEIDLGIIAQIESSGNPNAISFRGAKYGRGLHQISEICLQEYNQFNRTAYEPEDLFCVEINTKIAKWYLFIRIPQMLRHYGIEDTLENRLWAYNAGIGRVVQGFMPNETKNYIIKYRRLK